MIKRVSIILSVILFWVSLVVAQQQEKPKVDYRSDLTKSLNKGELLELTGNVAFHHNGAIITCDTAYKYSDNRFEGVGNVIINTDSTYIYGDKFTYDEKTSTARVYAPIIKTIDKDAILYTRNMEFNTLDNIGIYYDGGTLTQGDNLMESERGYYYTATRNIVLVGLVEMQNSDMTLKTDSVGFDLNTEYVSLFTKNSIWSSKGEYLESQRGSYDRDVDLYTFIDSAYVLTEDQELWADSIKYWSGISESEMNSNIQIIDTTQKMIAFGNYGHYWSGLKKVIMTEDPAVLTYNPQNKLDSVFMRADTLLVFPILSPFKDSSAQLSPLDSIGIEHNFDNLQFTDSMRVDSTNINTSLIDNNLIEADSTSLDLNEISTDDIQGDKDEVVQDEVIDVKEKSVVIEKKKRKWFQRKKKQKDDIVKPNEVVVEQKLTEKNSVEQIAKEETSVEASEEEVVDISDNKVAEDSIKELVDVSSEEITEISEKEVVVEKELTEKEKKKLERKRKKEERAEKRKKGRFNSWLKAPEPDSLAIDSSSLKPMLDSLVQDSTDLEIKEIKPQADSSDYIIRGIDSVKIFKIDMQAICDTLISISLDSTTHMNGSVVVWNNESQIIAKRIILFSANEQADRAELYDFPIMAQFVDPSRFNQVRGKFMEIFFKNNELDITYVDGNAQTVFYQEENEKPVGVFTATSSSMEISFDNSAISNINWIGDVKFQITPLDMITEKLELRLEGFEWHEDKKPTRKEIYNKAIRKTRRVAVEALKKPLFSITEQINSDKKRLTEEGVWRDRNEPVPFTLEEIIFKGY